MNGYDSPPDADVDQPPIKELTKPQRRVFGTLVEKAYTVPESYPMTLKAVTAGCNQKSNRAPVTSYSEDVVLQALDELRELGLAAVVHTESGRTERYRHYARKRFAFSEPQLAIVTELLLRGRQQLGELRARASRMVPIESLADLRTELEGLQAAGCVRISGSLDRRGVEVDHGFYQPSENVGAAPLETNRDEQGGETPSAAATGRRPDDWRSELAELRQSNQDFRAELDELRQALAEVQDGLSELRQSLGA